MAVLTVTQVRRHLYWSAGGPDAGGDGAGSIALLGQMFHDLYGVLTGPGEQQNLSKPLELADPSLASWSKTLLDHAYVTFISSALAQHESVLQPNAVEVANFWTAVGELCNWLAGVMRDLKIANSDLSIEAHRRRIFTGAEVDLKVEITDPSWPESIQLQGRADALLTSTANKRCLVELKLGRTAPQADLLQGCLYHMILAQQDSSLRGTSLAMVCFEPVRREQLYEARQLDEAQRALKAVLAELAGFKTIAAPSIAQPRAQSASTGIAPVPPAILQEMKRKLTSAYSEYGAPLTISDDALSGPAFVRFFATPQRGVSARKIAQLAENVWMRLGKLQKPPQVSLHAGRVMIDVERPDRQPVDFAQWRSKFPTVTEAGSAKFVVGIGVDGEPYTADLSDSQSPHLLVVGTPGSGKSEWLRAFIASLMAVNTPDTLRFSLIDPKRLAFSAMEKSKFLWGPVTYSEGVIELLDELIEEMESRYQLLQGARVDDLAAYNAISMPSGGAQPRLICICDEFADLLLGSKSMRKEIEARVARLAAKGRAAGVHLVFATQRAGREVLKGTIDSNLPGRVALSVTRAIDSQLVIGEPGAERLLGKGDLLYKDIGEPLRLQGLRVTREELDELAHNTHAVRDTKSESTSVGSKAVKRAAGR